MEQQKKKLIVLTGPTAVGKTKLSIQLAKAIGGEIISADSMQVYRGMDIGSAKITEEEKEGIPHYLIDVLDPSEEFNIVLFQQLAKEAIKQIHEKGKIPILAGGTGFYIQSVLYDIDFSEHDEKDGIRDELEAIAKEEQGPHRLHERLKEVDLESAKIIHENNVKRVIRALEFYEETGMRISEHNKEQHQKESPYDVSYFVLNDDRPKVYERIDKRVDLMIKAGLVEEVRRLKEQGCRRDMVSMQGLGYKEILDYLDGEIPLEEAIYRIKRDTRHFAKRQITWFKRERDVVWLDRSAYGDSDERILAAMLEILSRS
ncbi:MAG: tRNA (adenosine(37)-N6)-dimethylallyltransferase MiaA [Lachnospiraceae bacterium]